MNDKMSYLLERRRVFDLSYTYTCKIVPIEIIYIPPPTLGKFVEQLSKYEPGLIDIILDLCQPLANINSNINLEYIYKNLKTDAFITCIRYKSFPIKEYNKNTKKKKINRPYFHNVIGITLFNTLEQMNVNVKIFSNGKVLIGPLLLNEYNANEFFKKLCSRISDIIYNIVYDVRDFKLVMFSY